jgi:hypothetical protein
MSLPIPRRLLEPALLALPVIALGAAAFAVASATAASSLAPTTVKAHRIRADRAPLAKPGTVVKASAIVSPRDFVTGADGFAIVSLNRGGGAQYPATSTDGGKVWKVAGGHFHVNALNAPAVVTQIGVAGPSTYFAYGGPGGGQAVDVSTDRGKTWWQAFLPASPEAVVDGFVGGKRELVAFLQGSPTLVYVSRDGGRTWTAGKSPLL